MSEAEPKMPVRPENHPSPESVIEARRPQVTEEDFTLWDPMKRSDFSKEIVSTRLYQNHPEFFYAIENEKGSAKEILLPDFMYRFLYERYCDKWAPAGRGLSRGYIGGIRLWLDRQEASHISGSVLPGDEDTSSKENHAYTNEARVAEEYRRVQISRMTAEEADKARHEDTLLRVRAELTELIEKGIPEKVSGVLKIGGDLYEQERLTSDIESLLLETIDAVTAEAPDVYDPKRIQELRSSVIAGARKNWMKSEPKEN